jgi:hypothetical protein
MLAINPAMNDSPTPSPISQASQAPTPSLTEPQPMSPYQTPDTLVQPQGQPQGPANDVSALVISHLVRTRKWVRLCSVLGFIGSGFMLLGGLAMIISGSAMGASSSIKGTPYGTEFFLGIGLAYLVFALLYIYPSLRLWQYASSINQLESSPSSFHLETALDKQRSFWKFVGIMISIILGLYAVGIVLAIIGAVAMQMG